MQQQKRSSDKMRLEMVCSNEEPAKAYDISWLTWRYQNQSALDTLAAITDEKWGYFNRDKNMYMRAGHIRHSSLATMLTFITSLHLGSPSIV